MSTATYVRSRVDRSTLAAGLLVGDLVAITLLAAIGIVQHSGVGALGDVVHLVLVAAPFAIGWLVVAFLAGLYTDDAVASPVRAVSWTVPAWVVAALVGQSLRATALFPGDTALTFVLVTIAFGGLLVTGWRTVASLLS